MFKSNGFDDELLALKSEVSSLLSMPADETFGAAKSRTEALAEQIKTALSKHRETQG